MIWDIIQAVIYLAFAVAFIVWTVAAIKDIKATQKEIEAIKAYKAQLEEMLKGLE